MTYLSIGHRKGCIMWWYTKAIHYLTAESGEDHHGLHPETDPATIYGRIDKDKKQISIFSCKNSELTVRSVIQSLRDRFIGYEVWRFDSGRAILIGE